MEIVNTDALKDINVPVPKSGTSSLHNPIPNKPSLTLQYAALRGGPGVMSVPGSKLNNGGERGVMYCEKGWGSVHSVRTPATPNANSYSVPQGFARGQEKGLAYDARYPVDTDPLVPVSNFYSTIRSKIPYPK
eukprot:6183305-Pleurochrysis_carterae.AAC.2